MFFISVAAANDQLTNQAQIRVTQLSVAYNDFIALDTIDFKCKDGEFVSLVGKSGTGKSTFLNALSGFVPYQGKVEIRASVGYVFQNYALFPWMNVEKNIEFGLAGMERSQRRRRVREMLERIEMAEYARRFPSQLSGGQVQRVALARALAPDPDVLLMDEPYGALDHHTRDKMQDWLLNVWNESRKTVLFVTHYIEEALFLSDRVIVIRNKGFVADVNVPFARPRCDDLRFSERFLDMKHTVLDYMQDYD